MHQCQAVLLDSSNHGEDLKPILSQPFQPRRVPPKRAVELCRRSVPRNCIWRTPLVHLVKGDLSYKALLRDLSDRGIALLCSRTLEPGSVLTVHLRDRTTGCSWNVEAEVRHATLWKENRWLLGCQFTSPLPEDRVARMMNDEKQRIAKDKVLAELLNCPWVITWN